MFISICIPSYNRPSELKRLLESIDCDPHKIEIVISEDKSPKREEIRDVVHQFTEYSHYSVRYYENENNYGYDKNIRSFIERADGDYIVYMGDDDVFIPNMLDEFIMYIEKNDQCAYFLRSYEDVHSNGDVEVFKYYKESFVQLPGEKSYEEFYRRSVFISGFTFKRKLAIETLTERFDGLLLYQLYIQAELCMKYESAYYSIPITRSFEGGEFFFGTSDSEKNRYVPNKHTVENELTFISGFFEITNFIDQKYNINSTEHIMKEMSKYSYPMLALISINGKHDLKRYYVALKKIGFGCTLYFYLYYFSLLILGKNLCSKIIFYIKKTIGHTPKL